MTNDTDDEVRRLFNDIGCIMEDASLIALVWRDANLDLEARYRQISAAHIKIGERLTQIYALTQPLA